MDFADSVVISSLSGVEFVVPEAQIPLFLRATITI